MMIVGTRVPGPHRSIFGGATWSQMPPFACIGYDDHGVIPDVALLDFVDDRGGMVVAAHQAGIAGMLVVRADRLVEGYRREASGF